MIENYQIVEIIYPYLNAAHHQQSADGNFRVAEGRDFVIVHRANYEISDEIRHGTQPKYNDGVCSYFLPSGTNKSVKSQQFAIVSNSNTCPPPSYARYTSLYQVSLEEFRHISSLNFIEISHKRFDIAANMHMRSIFGVQPKYSPFKEYVATFDLPKSQFRYAAYIVRLPFNVYVITGAAQVQP